VGLHPSAQRAPHRPPSIHMELLPNRMIARMEFEIANLEGTWKFRIHTIPSASLIRTPVLYSDRSIPVCSGTRSLALPHCTCTHGAPNCRWSARSCSHGQQPRIVKSPGFWRETLPPPQRRRHSKYQAPHIMSLTREVAGLGSGTRRGSGLGPLTRLQPGIFDEVGVKDPTKPGGPS